VNIRADIISSLPVVPTEGGFPTFAGTDWADPIAASQWLASGESSSAGATTDDDANGTDTGGDGEDDRTKVRRRPGQGRGKRRGTVGSRASASGTRSVASGAALPAQASEPDFDEVLLALGPGGPGESWGDPDVVW